MSDDRDWPGAERTRGGLDEAIDRAVRRLMDVDPPSGLRRRVLARLDAPAGRVALLPRFIYAGAALALMVLTTLVLRDVPSVPPENSPAPVAVTPPPTAAPPVASTTTAPPADRRPRALPVQRRTPRIEEPARPSPDRRVSAASLIDDDVVGAPVAAGGDRTQDTAGLPPLAAIKALAPIELAPLVIEPLRIEPIPPPK